eukprot:m.254358 g.254358  ORF g.254358 m.254358 type:complete len:686 (+) comp18904_c0_seq1:93-2150(+)
MHTLGNALRRVPARSGHLALRSMAAAAGNLKIFWGSQTGTAQGFAQEFTDEATARGLACKNMDLKAFDPAQLKFDGTSIFMLACYGMGEPTDNARKFYAWLLEQKGRPFEGQRYAVFGLGSRSTHAERFCVIGKNVDERMAQLGGTRVWPRIDGDASDCIEVQFDDWQRAFLQQMEDEANGAEAKTYMTPEPTPSGPPSPAAAPVRPPSPDGPSCEPPSRATDGPTCDSPGRQAAKPRESPFRSSALAFSPAPRAQAPADPVQAFNTFLRPVAQAETVLLPIHYNRELTPRATRSTKEMSVSTVPVPGSSLTNKRLEYTTGDHLVVYPENQPDAVERCMDVLDLAAVDGKRDDPFTISSQTQVPASLPANLPLTLRRCLTSYVDLHFVPSPKILRSLSEIAARPDEAAWLRDLAEGDNYKREVVGSPRTLVDILADCRSIALPVGKFLELSPRLRPRYYSISSSSLEYPDDIHITYRVLSYQPKHASAPVHKGVCTTYLAGIQPAQPLSAMLPCYVYRSAFRMPPTAASPIIGIAGGTGIAPFKAFIGERGMQRAQQPGQQWAPFELFYGVNDQTEFAYGDEFLQAHKSGVLSNLTVAFVRDAPSWGTPGFVTEALRARASDVWRMLQQNAYVYVCGGAGGLGAGAARILKEDVIMKCGGLSRADAEAFFSTLVASKRYLEDLSD